MREPLQSMSNYDVVAIGGNTRRRGTVTPNFRYLVGLAEKRRPRICYLPTASGDPKEDVDRFFRTVARISCKPSVLSLFRTDIVDMRAHLLAQDVICVGGGNTRNMLLLWRAWGIDTAIREAWERGAVVGGTSAGGLCWFENGVTDSYPKVYRELDCLGWLPGSFCPHYDSEPQRQPALRRLLRAGKIGDGYAADDDVALHFRNGKLYRVLSQRRGAKAYRYSRTGPKATIRTIDPKLHS